MVEVIDDGDVWKAHSAKIFIRRFAKKEANSDNPTIADVANKLGESKNHTSPQDWMDKIKEYDMVDEILEIFDKN